MVRKRRKKKMVGEGEKEGESREWKGTFIISREQEGSTLPD
jgi:hypothetical protein